GGFRKVPRAVSDVLWRLEQGWTPRVVLSRAQHLSWNDKLLPSAQADVEWDEDGILCRTTCSLEDAQELRATMSNLVAGSLAHDTLRATHLGGWTVVVSNAYIASDGTHSTRGRARFQMRGLEWEARRSVEGPDIWIAPMPHPLPIGLANLLSINTP